VLISRRSNCINTSSGIVFSVSDGLVCTQEGQLQTVHRPGVVLIQFDLLKISTELLETCRGL